MEEAQDEAARLGCELHEVAEKLAEEKRAEEDSSSDEEEAPKKEEKKTE
jgi:hypothetical protein